MKKYAPNSPEAMARLLAMYLVTDGNMDDHELESLDALHVYPLLGISRKHFIEVLVDYCNDISDEAEADGTIHLVDKERVDALIADITDRPKRLMLCALLLDLGKSHGDITEPEMALLGHIMGRWNLTLADVETELIGR